MKERYIASTFQAELATTIDSMLKIYQNLRVVYPSDLENHFLVKAGKRKKR